MIVNANTQILTETIEYLHAEFLKANENVMTSFAKKVSKSFRRVRYMIRWQCLCVNHENGRMKALPHLQPGERPSVSDFMELPEAEVTERINALEDDEVEYEWQLCDTVWGVHS